MERGKRIYLIPDLVEEIEKVKRKNNLRGWGSSTVAQKKCVEHIKIGREVEKIYSGITDSVKKFKPKWRK